MNTQVRRLAACAVCCAPARICTLKEKRSRERANPCTDRTVHPLRLTAGASGLPQTRGNWGRKRPNPILPKDLDIRIIHATTGEILRELTLDPTQDTNPKTHKKTAEPTKRGFGRPGCPETSQRCPRRDSNPHCADFKSAASADWATGAPS